MECLRWRGSTDWVYLDSADLNFSNRPVRTRMPGGVAGARPDGRLLCRFPNAKKEPKGFAPPFGASLRLGIPSLRHCSGGPPPSAIHGRGRLPRHPCRGAPCATPAFGLWERGKQIKIKSQSNGNGNGKINSFASKPAPT